MKSTVEQLSPTRVKINVEVPFDELKPDFDRAYKKIAQQVRIPGFRPGKVPARIIEARLGRGAVLDEVVNDAVPAKYAEAVSAADEVTPLGRPDIEVTEIDDGDKLAFTAEVDVRPEITLPGARLARGHRRRRRGHRRRHRRAVDDLRARFGTLTGVERPAAKDDFVLIDLSATVDGEPVEEATTTGFSYQVGQGGLIDGIDEAITGLSAGESATFTTKLVAGEYADREAEVTVTVTAVKERELPEADDEFAQLASEFDTLDELSADLRERLRRVKRMDQVARPGTRCSRRCSTPPSAAAGERRRRRGRRRACTTPCTPSTTTRTGSPSSSPGRARPARSSTPRPGRTPRSRCAPGWCWTRWPTPSRSRSATRSSPSGSSSRPSSTGCRPRSSSSGSRRPASSARSSPTCGGARR